MPETAETVASLQAEARTRLRAAGIDGADGDVRILLSRALGRDGAWLHLYPDAPVDGTAAATLRSWLVRREAGEPVHRILGRRSFYTHEFELSPETLEPRPDTEALVELAAGAVREKLRRRDSLLLADLGTGSGAIAVSLLALFEPVCILAVDLAPGAVATAHRNARAAGVERRFLPFVGDYLAACGATLDLMVSNPPYIPTAELETLAVEVRTHDPRLALDGGADGLDAYRRIAAQAPDLLARDGDLVVEIGAGQKADVLAIFRGAGLTFVDSKVDLGGHERALWFHRDSSVK